MIPIFEQGPGKGIGHSLRSFRERFDKICSEHIHTGRAKAFALIFYDFTDQHLRRLLKDQGVFVQLDRLAGDKLSIFFLHTGSRRSVEAFNQQFLSQLGIAESVTLPAVVFFKVKEGELSDIAVIELDNSDLVHGFRELYDVIEKYIADELAAVDHGSHAIRWLKSGAKFISTEAFAALLGRVFQAAGF
jgi:hypothetical protein